MDLQSSIPVTMCVSKAGLIAGTTSTISTANPVTYCVKGKCAPIKATTANIVTPTVDYATGLPFNPILPNFGSVFTIGLDFAGNLRVVQGQVLALDKSGNFFVAPQFGGFGPPGSAPSANDFCPIGYVVVKAGATAAVGGWVFGTSAFAGPPTGVTFAFQDLLAMPDHPQVA
jgi:hypothetical protein